jgi:hypothetical protein
MKPVASMSNYWRVSLIERLLRFACNRVDLTCSNSHSDSEARHYVFVRTHRSVSHNPCGRSR